MWTWPSMLVPLPGADKTKTRSLAAGQTNVASMSILTGSHCLAAPLKPEVQIELLDGAESLKKEENDPRAKQPRISQYFSSSTKLSNDDDFHTSMIKIRSDLF